MLRGGDVRNMGSSASKSMVSLTLLLPLASPLLLPLFLLGTRTCLLPSRLVNMMMVFFKVPTPHFSTRLPPHSYLRQSGSSPRRSGPSQTGIFYTLISCDAFDTWGSSPFLFSPSISLPPPPPPSPHQTPVLVSPSLRSPLLPYLPSLLVSLYSLLLHLRHVAQLLCHVLSSLTSPVTMCLCVGLSSIFPIVFPHPHFPRLLRSPTEIWETYDLNYHLSS